MDTVAPGFIGTGGYHAAVSGTSAYDYGFASQLGIIPLFHRGVERIDIHVKYDPFHTYISPWKFYLTFI
jgi:hypothetical protein